MRLAVLTNFIGPYRPALFRELERQSGDLRVLVSGAGADCVGLPVHAQRSFRFNMHWSHPHDFQETTTIHIPYDTIPQLLKYRPTAIVSGELGMRTLQASLFRLLDKRTRLVIWATVSEITEQGRGWLRPFLRRVLLRSADAVIVNGHSGARYIRRFGIDEAKIFRVPQTTELRHFLDSPIEKPDRRRHRLLYCGRLIPFKGLLPFVDQLAKWCSERTSITTELWIAGDGPAKELLARHPLPSNLSIRLLGHISYDRLPQVYATCGIFAFPTLADEWGLAVVEAMASGLPVLGSVYSQAVEDLVTDGENGWVFRPDQPDGVRHALDCALGASPDKLAQMGSRARERVSRMTPSDMADRMMAAIRYATIHGS